MKTLAVMLLVGLVMGGTALAADTVKFGLVTHKTGPLVAASKVTGFPAAKLWVAKVNERGGLKVDGTRKKIELIVYDDKTNPGEHIKAVQRLATRDKVDFMVAPMGTGFNLAAAPIYAKYNYPLLAVSAVTDKMAELSKRYPSMFFTLGTTTSFVEGALNTLEKLRKDGVIGSRVAMVNVADAFGIELADAARPRFKAAEFEITYDKSYPLGTPDLSPVIKAAKATRPDAFVAWSYPPDSFALTQQAIVEKFDVKVYYTATATAYPAFLKTFGSKIEGNLGMGGINPDSDQMASYIKDHKKVTGQPPDNFASPMHYAALQILERAIEAVGTIDQAKTVEYIKKNSHDTILGKIKFNQHNSNEKYWTVGQWQKGVFRAVADEKRGDSVPVVPKKGWE
jgi:branched-chain amino acid transport system substrate-binding protein